MNFLDRVVSYVSPMAGLKRASARITLDEVRAYDGAMMGRRTNGWAATNASANVEIKGALPRLRARARDVARNTWWGARIKTVFVAHAIGAGIMPKPNTGDKALDKQVKKAWKRWAKDCDFEGQLNFDGLLALMTGCVIESGETLTRLHTMPLARRRNGLVPLELQLLEPDHLDGARDRVIGSGDAVVDQGIEYSAETGRRRAYWLLPVHPGARGLVMPHASKKIDAADVLHVYRKDRIGQGRGVPWVAPVLLKGRDVADVEEAITIKSRIEACLAAFIKTNNPARTLTGGRNETAADGTKRRIENLSPGMVGYLDAGEDVVTVSPTASVQFESVLMTNWLTLAAGAGITYDQLTGDLRRANFSSLRAGKIEFRRIVEQFQWHTLVAMYLEPLWDRWCQTAILAGILPERADGYPVEWLMPANEPIDPLKDMQADLLAVRTGRMTWPQFVGAWGLDPETQLDEIQAWFKSLDERDGMKLDSDPRQTLVSPIAAAKQAAAETGAENDDTED